MDNVSTQKIFLKTWRLFPTQEKNKTSCVHKISYYVLPREQQSEEIFVTNFLLYFLINMRSCGERAYLKHSIAVSIKKITVLQIKEHH
ncbi:CLUMA_CG018843, isoform A [Clunio marinus]|uniref:CLUMA_CG018843, isoform A n=1 Tax=Clunio marinus TaxID=568069 RepID=A0A1J1J2X9_9DIPT|nr:CLUMA_CG018843, isoform A [Clunio marinus]